MVHSASEKKKVFNSKRDSEVTGLRSYVSPSWQLPDEYFEKVSQGFKAGWDLI